MSSTHTVTGAGIKSPPSWEDRLNLVDFGGLRLSIQSLHLWQLAAFREELSGKSILMPGFANFPEAMWLVSAGAQVVGVDSSYEGCKSYNNHWLAKKNAVPGTLDIHQVDIRDYVKSISDDAFHAIVSELLIQIFPRAEQAHLLGEFRRIVKPGGLLILTALASGDQNFPSCPDLVKSRDLIDQFQGSQWTVQQCVEYEEGAAHSHANGERHIFPHRLVLFIARRNA